MKYDEAFKEVMARKVHDDGVLTALDLYLIGQTLLNVVNVSITLGHTSPANSLDYIADPTEADHVSKHIIHDLLAWVSGRKHLAPDCDLRLRAFVAENWQRQQLAAVHVDLTENGEAA